MLSYLTSEYIYSWYLTLNTNAFNINVSFKSGLEVRREEMKHT